MLCFFAMGFVDLVGIASNYVKADLNLTDSQANIFPVSGVLLVPHLLRTYGYADEPHRTQEDGASQPCHHVCLFASPGFGDGYVLMLLSFSLLGIGNALMQTSLNPLLPIS